MKFVIKKEYNDVVKFIQSKIKQCEHPDVLKPGFLMKDEIIGFVDGGHIWLQKTSPKFTSKQIQKFFDGKIVADGKNTIITGKMRHTWVTRLSMVIFLMFALMFLSYDIKSGQEKFYLIPLATILLIFLFYWGYTKVLYYKEDDEIIQFLKSIEDRMGTE